MFMAREKPYTEYKGTMGGINNDESSAPSREKRKIHKVSPASTATPAKLLVSMRSVCSLHLPERSIKHVRGRYCQMVSTV